jgi:hypothetical protein
VRLSSKSSKRQTDEGGPFWPRSLRLEPTLSRAEGVGDDAAGSESVRRGNVSPNPFDGDSYRRRENSYTPTTELDGVGSCPPARSRVGQGACVKFVRDERRGSLLVKSLEPEHNRGSG